MPFTRKLNVVYVIWQVFWLKALSKPSHSDEPKQWYFFNNFTLFKPLYGGVWGRLLTATGIAPDFLRLTAGTPDSLLMQVLIACNQIGANVGREMFRPERVFNNYCKKQVMNCLVYPYILPDYR